jgi:hypothetical protein
VKGPTLGLSQQVVKAGSSLILVTRVRVASSSVNAGTVRHCQTGRVRQARWEGVRVGGTSGRTPSSHEPAPNLADMGRTAVHASDSVVVVRGDSDAGQVGWWGGHEEGLRRTRGEAAGEQLGTSPVDRSVSERGNHPGSPSPPPSRGGGGQARRRLRISDGTESS